MRIIFFGTPYFAAHILDHLLDQKQEIVGIVTRPDRPKGRSQKVLPSEVKALAGKKCPDVALMQPEKASTDSFAKELEALNPDVFVVAAYGEIIKKNLLSVPKKNCINVHPSILPKYRGATPIQSALFNGEIETGVTIMEMVLAMDAGDILEIVKTPIPENMIFGELEEILCNLAGPALLRVLKKIETNTLIKIPQDHSTATFCKKITPEDRFINWKGDATNLHNQIRALSPKPGAYCFIEEEGQLKRLGIKRSEKILNMSGEPGKTLLFEKDLWIVACGRGALSLVEVQLEGKKSLPIREFFRGFQTAPLIKS